MDKTTKTQDLDCTLAQPSLDLDFFLNIIFTLKTLFEHHFFEYFAHVTFKVILISMLDFGAEHRRRRRPNNDTKSYLFFISRFQNRVLFHTPSQQLFLRKVFFCDVFSSCVGTEAAVPDQKARQQLQRPAVDVRNFGAQPGALKMRPWLVLVFCLRLLLFMRLRFCVLA